MKIVFLNSIIGLPVPSTMGGGAEELLTLLLEENEKSDGKLQFYFVQKMLYGENNKYLPQNNYKNSHLVFIKYNRLVTYIQRVINKIFKFLKLKKNTPFYFPINYHNQALKKIKKINPDLIIFEGQIDANIKKYQNTFGINKLYMHLHVQDLEKVHMQNNVKGIISVSEFVKRDYDSFLDKSSEIMNNEVLLNCINEERFNKKISSKERNEIKKKLGFNADDFIVIFVGRICPAKGVKELINAVLKCDKNVKLMIVGGLSSIRNETSSYIREVEKLCKENSDKIKFTGYVKNSELYKYYQSSDLQVIPSTWNEAAGLVVIEGQVCGLPQIIAKSGGMVEYAASKTIVLDVDNAFVDNLTNAITKLSRDEKLRKVISTSGLENAKKYTKENYYKNFTNLVNEVIK